MYRDCWELANLLRKVGAETEHSHFDDDFFQEQDLVVNALDNVEARRFMDRWALMHLLATSPAAQVQHFLMVFVRN